MPLFGKIVVIRRDGVDGAQFPLTTATCIFGRNADCDIRVQLPNVAKEHCRIEVDADGNIFLVNLCPVYPTLLNKKAVTERVQVQHMDVFTVTDRSFRVELPPGSPLRKSRPSTDSVSPIQSTGPVKSENVMELWTEQLSTLMVKDEPLLSISTNNEQSAAEKESSPRKMGIRYTPKGKTPTAKARTPSYSVRTPLQKGKALSPAVRSSANSKAKTPTGVKQGTHTPSVGQRSANSRTGNTSAVTPRSKTPVFSSSLAKSNSALLADEIAELKLALTKHKDQSPARTSVLKTPVGTARFHSATVKAKTPAAGDKIKTPSVTPRVRSNIVPTPKSKTLISASILKTPVVTPAAKTPVTTKSKGLATKTSSVHRVKKVMTPSPRAKAQKRRSSSIPSPAIEIIKRPPLRNTVPQTDSLDASQDQQETVDSTLETSLGDKISSETASLAGEKSSVHRVKKVMTPSPRAKVQRRRSSSIPSPAIKITKRPPLQNTVPQTDSLDASEEAVDSTLESSLGDETSNEIACVAGEKSLSRNLSPAQTLGHLKTGSPKISSPTGPSTRRKSLSPVTRSPGSSLTRSKSHSPRRGPAKSPHEKMLQSTEILTKKRRSSSSSNNGANKLAEDSPPHQISSPANNLIPSQDHVEAVDSILEIALMDKASDEAVSSDGKPHTPKLTPAEGRARRKSRSSKVSSPGEPPARVKSQSPDVEAHITKTTRSPGSSLTRIKSQSPHRGPEKSHSPFRGSAEKLSEGVETPVLHRRSSTRPSIGAKQSQPRGKSHSPLRSSAESSAENLSQGVETPALPRRSSSRPSVGAKQSPLHEVLSQASGPNVPQVQMEALHSTSFVDTASGEIFSPTDKKLKSPKLSPAEVRNRRKSESSLTTSPSSLTRSKPQSPLGSSAELSAQKKSQSSQMSPVDEDKTKRKLQSSLQSPTEVSHRMSRRLTTSSTRSKSQSPLRSPTEPSNRSPPDSVTHSKSQSPKGFPGETSARRKSQYPEAPSPSKNQDSSPAVTDECFLESYKQQHETPRRKSQYPEASSPPQNQDSTPAVTDECFLESYDQQFSPLILEMDDLDENKDSPKKTTSISSPVPKGSSDPGSLKSAVGRLRRKSQPLLEESEDEIFSTKSAGKEIDTTLEEFDLTFGEQSFVSPSQGVKRRGSPLKGLPSKKRCVSFGPDMSPELFDRSLPVATPLKRGATPRRTSTSVDQVDIHSKPLLKNRRSVLSTAAATLLEEPLEARSGKSPKDLKVMEKLSKGVRQNPVLESMTFAATDLEPSQPVITPLRRQAKPRRASVVEEVVYPKSLRKSRRATLATAGVIPEAPLEENPEKSPKSSKVQAKEGAVVVVDVAASVDAEVLAASAIQTPISSVVSPVMVGSQTGSQNRKIFTSGTGTKRLSRALKTPPAAEVATSNENSPAVKTPARKEKTPKLRQSLPPRSSHPLTNMQNSSILHQEIDPFAFESSPESSPTKLTPKPTGHSKKVEVNTAVSEDLATRFVLESGKKKLLSKSQEDITTPTVLASGKKKLLSKSQEDITTPIVLESGKKKLLSKSQEDITTPKVSLGLTEARSATSHVKSSRSVGRNSAKDVGLEQEHELPETPTTIVMEELRSAGRRSSKANHVTEAVYETPVETTPNIPRSIGRRSSKPITEAVDETPAETTPNIPRSTGRRSSKPKPVTEAVDETPAETTPNIPRSTGRRSSKPITEAVDETPAETTPNIPRSTGRRSSRFLEEEQITELTPVVDKSSSRRSTSSSKFPSVKTDGKARSEQVFASEGKRSKSCDSAAKKTPRSTGKRGQVKSEENSKTPDAKMIGISSTGSPALPAGDGIPPPIEHVTELTPVVDKSSSRRSAGSSKISSAKTYGKATSEQVFASEEKRSRSCDSASKKTPRSTGKRGQIKSEGNLKTPDAIMIGKSSTGSPALPAGDGIPPPIEHVTELTPVVDKSSSRRSAGSSKISSAKTYGKATSEQVFASEGKRSKSCDSAAKTSRSTGKRGQIKSEENSKTPDAKMIGKSSTGSPALPAGDGIPTPIRLSGRKSSSPFKRPFGSEPRKLRLSQIGELFRLSPEDARRAGRAKNMAGQMVSERNIDLSSLSPLKFYKSPAVEALAGKWSKVTPGRAVALRAVYGKSAVLPLAELRVSRKASEITSADRSEKAKVADETTKSLPAEKSSSSKVTKRKKSTIQVVAKKNLEKKTGFGVKKKQTKVLLLKRVGRRSIGQVVKRFLPARQRNQRAKSDNTQMGQNSLPNIAENDVLEVSAEKAQTLAESSKSPSSYSVLLTPNGPGEMSVSPWSSSPVLASSRRHRSGDRTTTADDSSKGQTSPSFAGLKRLLASPGEGNSPNVSGKNSPVKTSQVESSPQLIGVKQLAKSPKSENSPRLSGVRKLVKTREVQKSPQLSGVKNLVRTPKVQKSPKLIGVRNLVKTPKTQNSPKLSGVKILVKTPKVQKSPQLSGVRKLVKTPKLQKSPKLIGVRNLVKTPKIQKSPQLIGIRNLVKTPRVQKSPKLSGVRMLVKTPKGQKSPRLNGVKKLVKTPKVQKSPQLSGVRNLMRTPKVQESPDLTGVKALFKSPMQLRTPQLDGLKDLISTPRVLSSPESSGLNELVQSPATRSSLQPSSIHKTVKTPKTQQSAKRESIRKSLKTPTQERSPRLGGVKALAKTPKIQPTPKLGGLRNLVRTPKEIFSPELEGVRELFQIPSEQLSARETRVKSPVKSPEVIESSQFGAKLGSPEASVVKQSARKARSANKSLKPSVTPIVTEPKEPREFASLEDVTPVRPVGRTQKLSSRAKSTDKSLKSSVTPIVTEQKEPREFAPMEDVTPVRPVGRTRKLASQAGVEKVKDIPQLSTENVHNDENVGKEDKTVAAKTRKRKIAESDEKPAAQKRRVAVETEDSTKNDSKELHSAVKKGRGSKKVAAETSTGPAEVEVAASVSNTRGRLRNEKGDESSALQGEKRQVMLAAASPKLAGSRNSRSQRAKTMQVEQVTVEENVPATVEETVKLGARRQARSSKKDLPEEPAVTSEDKAKSKTRAKGKGKATQAETEVFAQKTEAENVEVLITPAVEKSDCRQRGRAKKDAIKEVVQAEAVVKKAERKTSARGKAVATEVEVSSEQVTVEENVKSPVAVKVGNRRRGRAQDDAMEELNVQSKAIVIVPERKSRTKAQGKTKQTDVEVEVNVEASVQETAKLGGRRQVRSLKKDTIEEADTQTESVVNKTGSKVGSRGKAKTQSTEAVEENLEKTVRPNVRTKKQAAKEDTVDSSAVVDDNNADKTVEVKRPVRGRKMKSDRDKAGGKGRTVAAEETDNQTAGQQLSKTENAVVASGKRGRKGAVVEPVSSTAEVVTEVVQSYKIENAVVASGKRGRKGAVVEPVTSAAVVVAEVVQSSRKRKAKTVEEIASTETKKVRMHVEALETAKEVSPKPLKRGSKKASTGAANNKGGKVHANENLIPADSEPTEIPARSRNKRKTEIAQVSSTTDEEIKANCVGKKRGKSSLNKAELAESSEAPKSKNTVTSQRQKTIKQISNEVDHAVDSQPKGRGRKVKFDVPPTTAVDSFEKVAQSAARGRSGASKRGSENKTASKESHATVPKARVSRSTSALKDTATLPAKRASRK